MHKILEHKGFKYDWGVAPAEGVLYAVYKALVHDNNPYQAVALLESWRTQQKVHDQLIGMLECYDEYKLLEE